MNRVTSIFEKERLRTNKNGGKSKILSSWTEDKKLLQSCQQQEDGTVSAGLTAQACYCTPAD